jgi:hypothetical protein
MKGRKKYERTSDKVEQVMAAREIDPDSPGVYINLLVSITSSCSQIRRSLSPLLRARSRVFGIIVRVFSG